MRDYNTINESNERMEAAPLQARSEMHNSKNKGATYLAWKSALEDIVNAADPSIKDDLIMRKDKILKDLRGMFNLNDASANVIKTYNKVVNGMPVEANIIKTNSGYSVQSTLPEDDKDCQLLEQCEKYLINKGYKIMDKLFTVKYKDRMFVVKAETHKQATQKVVKKLLDKQIKDARDINVFKACLRHLSKMYSFDPGIDYVIKYLKDYGFDVTVDSISGWNENRNVPGEHIKQYRMSVVLDGKEHHFLVQLYADMGVWKVKEINAYMLDSNNIKQGKHMKDTKLQDKYVLYQRAGVWYGTKQENYGARIQNANAIQSFKSFNSVDDIIEYLSKYGNISKEDIIVKDSVKDEDFSKKTKHSINDAPHFVEARELKIGMLANFQGKDGVWVTERVKKVEHKNGMVHVETDTINENYFPKSRIWVKDTINDAKTDMLDSAPAPNEENDYEIWVSNNFGKYKVANWKATSKEVAKNEFLEYNPKYKKVGIIEVR